MVYTVEELAGAMPDVSHLKSCEPEMESPEQYNSDIAPKKFDGNTTRLKVLSSKDLRDRSQSRDHWGLKISKK